MVYRNVGQEEDHQKKNQSERLDTGVNIVLNNVQVGMSAHCNGRYRAEEEEEQRKIQKEERYFLLLFGIIHRLSHLKYEAIE